MTMKIDKLKSVLDYNPVSGQLMWIANTGKKRLIGKYAGAIRRDGYMRVGVDGKEYYAHRIAWAIFYGSWPSSGLDHVNGNTSDNRIENLRLANQSQNIANSKVRKSQTGVKGVYKTASGKYLSQITVKYKPIYLGIFDSKEDASVAYQRASLAYFGEYARLK